MPPIAKKRARFALEKDYQIYSVPHRWDYDATQRAEIWITKQEYQEIRDEMKRVVALMNGRNKYGRHNKLTPLQECVRGLECQTEQGAVAKKVACLDGICAVLMEQDHQQSVGDFSAEAIRMRYIEMNSVHVDAAVRRAQQDADYENQEVPAQSSPCIASQKAGSRIVNARRNRSRISRLLFGTPQRNNSYEKGRRAEETH